MSASSILATAQRVARWRYRIIALLAVVVLVATLAGFALLRSEVAASPANAPQDRAAEQIIAGSYRWSYAAKFVCGYQPQYNVNQPGEPVVKPGNYATDINIHNPNYAEVRLDKKLIVTVLADIVSGREPESVEPRKKFQMTLRGDFVTMDDCNNLWHLLFPGALPPPPPAPSLFVGYLVILSPRELDVDVVYTAEVPGTPNAAGTIVMPTGISIDVERVTGKRVFVPTGLP